MNTILRRSLVAVLAVLVTAGATPAVADPLELPTGPPLGQVFDVQEFENQIRMWFDGNTIGYAYAIYQHGVLKRAGGNGHAVLPSTPMTADKRVTLLSMSKTITAVALMRAMEIARQQGRAVSVESPIAPYLPHDWDPGRKVGLITFRDLLRHESGLRGVSPLTGDPDPDLYANLRATILRGVVIEGGVDQLGKETYCNCNFALLRVLIPRVLEGPPIVPLPSLFPSSDPGEAYVDFVRQELLQPIGLNVSVFPTGPTPYTRYYNAALPQYFMPPDRTGMDAIKRSGAGYWYMSPKEFGHFLSQVHLGNVISPGSWTTMVSQELGLFRHSGSDSAIHGGPYHWHNGGIGYTNVVIGLVPVVSGAGGAWMMFPNGVIAVAYHNANATLPDPANILRYSFNASWSFLQVY